MGGAERTADRPEPLAWQLQNLVRMKVAIPVWDGRVSPVFDVAKAIRVFDLGSGKNRPIEFETQTLNVARPATVLVDLGVDVLVCSAVSSMLETSLRAAGIEVISDICGSPDDIITALAVGDTALNGFRAPGSRPRGQSTVGQGSSDPRGPRFSG